MPKYFARTQADMDYFYEPPLIPALSVIEVEAVPTGLVDAEGYDIYRMPNPIGFGRNEEW